jgi:hypothetical protein
MGNHFARILCLGASLAFADAFAGVSVTVDASSGVKPVSPYLYGRNIYCNGNSGDLNDVVDSLTEKERANLETYRQAGIRYLRMNNGNNATKHNWRKNITSHPDYYNNVYAHNWDISAKKVLDNLPGVDAMYAFQLTGYAASSTEYNFADWDYKQAHGQNAPANLNLAGGGEVDDSGNLIKAGNSALYLEEWPADSTVGILPHWKDELKYDMKRLQYWSMDNEMEIWRGTHDDLPYEFPDSSTVAPERMIENYVAVAKAAKKLYPDVKLTGPVVANEWSWCNIRYDNNAEGKAVTSYIKAPDHNYCWLEYFIKRLGEEQKKSDVQLLDVFDIHWYPTEKNYESWINWHRIFFDTTYNYPGANGIKRANETCKWDESITKEYIFKRIDDWMKKYVGEDYDYTFGFTETDFIADMDAMTRAVVYASFMGTFMDHGVEIFTPWTWREGMYEVVHLFSRYGKEFRVNSPSSLDSLVSAYTTLNGAGDSMTVILVNRAENTAQTVDLDVDGFDVENGEYKTLTLAGIEGETFVSHEQNALKSGTVAVQSKKASLSLPAKSITAVLLNTASPKPISMQPKIAERAKLLVRDGGSWFVNNTAGSVSRVDVFNTQGHRVASLQNVARGTVRVPTEGLVAGQYFVRVQGLSKTSVQKITLF